MSKSSFFTGQPIFNQLLKFIPRHWVAKISHELGADRYCKRFSSYDHLVTLLYSIFNHCQSLREVTSGLLAWEHRLHHIGMKHFPRRSTISDAGKRRGAEVFEQLYLKILDCYKDILPDSRSKKSSKLYIFDSTTITLFQDVLKGTGLPAQNGRRKGGIKVHTLARSDQDVPCMIRFSEARANDSRFLKEVQLPAGSVIVFDKGYNDYRTCNRFSKQKISWVTRLRNRTAYEIIRERPVSEQQQQKGVVRDQEVLLGHQHKKDSIKVRARIVTYRDPATGKEFDFLTNNTRMYPATIAGLYRQRWQIELLFKRLKQNYPLKYFLGDSENAIKIQIWCVLIADLLLKLVKKGASVNYAFSNLATIIRLHLMTYIGLFDFIRYPEKALLQKLKDKPPDNGSLLLFQ